MQQGYVTKDDYENLHDYLFVPYKKLGGNGIAEKIMKEVDKLPLREREEIKMTKEQAIRMAKMQAVMCGGVATVNGKQLTGKNGYMYLDGVKVQDVDNEVLAYVDVDEMYVNQLMAE